MLLSCAQSGGSGALQGARQAQKPGSGCLGADSQLPGELTGCASSWRDRGADCCNFPGWRLAGTAVFSCTSLGGGKGKSLTLCSSHVSEFEHLQSANKEERPEEISCLA